jgi:hypothetical protein
LYTANPGKIMRSYPFQLNPFQSSQEGCHPPVDITGTVEHCGAWLNIHYRLSGNTQWIIQPSVDTLPQRRDRLWQHTCFELFVATVRNDQYWEYNVNVHGHWNVYHFSQYRENQRWETRIDRMESCLKHNDAGLLQLDITAPLAEELTNEPLLIGISCVIEDDKTNLHYYALSHPADKPDFHQRQSFCLAIAV